MKNNIVFEITKEEEGGCSAGAGGDGFLIVTQGETFDELMKNIEEAVVLFYEVDQEEVIPIFNNQPTISINLPSVTHA